MGELGRARGILLVSVREYVSTHEGVARWGEILRALPDEDRHHLGELVLAGGWYPVGVWNRLVDEIRKREGDRYVLRLARHIADSDLSLIFRIALKLGSPEFVVKRFGWVFKQYFRGAQLESAPRSSRRWGLTITGGTGVDEAPGEAVCAIGTEG